VNAAIVFPGGIPDTIAVLGHSALETTASLELEHGWRGILQHEPLVISGTNATFTRAVVIGTQAEVEAWHPSLKGEKLLTPESYKLQHLGSVLIIEGADDHGVLYGAFALLRLIAEEHPLNSLDVKSAPWASIRWTNEWDNPDGSIERGYAGPSIFFQGGKVRADLSRAAAYARLLSSIGINGCAVNNVNADLGLLKPENLKELARIADVFRPYGVKLSLSIDMSSPLVLGGLKTFDPLDPQVAEWWKTKIDEIYRTIPDFGGVVIKADAEGRPGPSQYGRTPADAANVVARALKPHGGVVLYRGFVYNHHLDWRDMKADRARAGYDNFHALDGKFEDKCVSL